MTISDSFGKARAEGFHREQGGCGCDSGCTRRDFLAGLGWASGGLALTSWTSAAESPADSTAPDTAAQKEPAVIRTVFCYPPSSTMQGPDGWWSWPGNFFDAEGRQKQYMAAFAEMEKRLGVQVVADETSAATHADAEVLAKELADNRPDGLLIVLFYNRMNPVVDLLLKTADELEIPTIFYIALGSMHQHQLRAGWRRPGLYLIESLDNMEAIESGLRMIHARKRMAQSLLLSITEASEEREGIEPFFGTRVRVVPFERYADAFHAAKLDDASRQWITSWVENAEEIRWVDKDASLEAALRAHLALEQLLKEYGADGLTMNCLRRGMLKPCLSFARLNGSLVPVACENDLPAMYTLLLGSLLTGRGGFQGNPAYDTEKNHYYLSHCTCPTKLHGPDGQEMPYLLTRFAHSNEGSCANQTFWPEGEPVTLVRYYRGAPPALDVYAGKVVKSHPMPPAAGCTTNVELEITDRQDALMVQGHHNVLFAGDFAKRFRMFANLYGMQLHDTGFLGPWPM